MQRTALSTEALCFPDSFAPFLEGARVFDSSSSPEARVFYLEKDGGYFLKKAKAGTLGTEAAMNTFFFQKGMGPEVLAYEQLEADWLLTRKLPGEDCTCPACLEEPQRLCDILAECLRLLHDTEAAGCPVPDHRRLYLRQGESNYRAGKFDPSIFGEHRPFATAREAWAEVEKNGRYLEQTTLLHGDFCLPNVMLENWRFSGFLDLGNGGIGDRHVDLFWGLWSLWFNLKTDRFSDRFLDAYGREKISMDALRTVAAIENFG